MKATIVKTLTVSVIRILRPLVRLLLRNGMSFVTFSNIAKWVYVDTATREFGLDGRKQSISRVSVITGLSRKEVKKVREMPRPVDTVSAEQYNRAARVIAAWRREKDFTDAAGNPLILPLQGKGDTFAGLVRKFSGDMPFRAVLDELVSAGAVRKLENSTVKLVARSYIPGNNDAVNLHILGTDVGSLITTIDHNLQSDESKRFFQRKVSYDNLPREALAGFHAAVSELSQKLLEDLGSRLAKCDRDTNPETEGTGRYRSGVGIYYFEEPVDKKD
ncbi:MAG: hypothetical protein DRH32_06255 [Deltaproteobacteria bacterium]|nr:MAG: hypothetical protein DRH32_06255 [Deltaproteobacteria bacterium]